VGFFFLFRFTSRPSRNVVSHSAAHIGVPFMSVPLCGQAHFPRAFTRGPDHVHPECGFCSPSHQHQEGWYRNLLQLVKKFLSVKDSSPSSQKPDIGSCPGPVHIFTTIFLRSILSLYLHQVWGMDSSSSG